ncbi:MAG TPA: T9SS type A sorting domain-containing protein, partial [Bacteroidia bacterium]|nr:T9SS type A sorting domain-containing protein [Bacteroidia bacterium]
WVSVSQGSPLVTRLDYEVNTKDITLKLGSTGIEEKGSGLLAIYPNPAGSYINIGYITESNENTVIEITDITGKQAMVLEHTPVTGYNTHELDVSSLASGMYIITVKTGNNSYMNKLIIDR